MDASTRRRLILGFISNWISKVASTIINLVGVPIFLHYWSVPVYAEWLVLNALPTYLNQGTIGFGNVAGNDMSILEARGDRQGAISVFQSCWMLISIFSVVAGGIASAVVWYCPVTAWLHLSAISESDAKWIILYLGWSVLLGQLEQLLQSAYRCVGRYPYGSLLKSLIVLSAFAVTMVAVVFHADARKAALCFAAANITGTLLLCVLVKRDIPWIEFGWKHARWSELERMSGPAFSFMGFPLGNALNLQGSTMAINYALGPLDVVIFSTARTVSRVALQMIQMVNNTVWPEISLAHGANNIELIRTLHRRACQIALGFSVFVVTIMMLFGPWFLHRWTHGKVPPSPGLLAILLLVVVVYSLWSTSATLHQATNRHQRLAAWYAVATAVTVVLTYLSAKYFGLYAAAASLLLSEVVMNFYVLPESLHMAHDTLGGFTASLFHIPDSLRPGALLGMVRRRIAR